MKEAGVYVGIDVSKDWLDVAVRPGGDSWRGAYGEAGVGELASQLQVLGPEVVVLEATGGHRRSGDPSGGRIGGSVPAGGGGQSPAGARLRQSHRQAGQDRCAGRPGSGPFRRGGSSAGSPLAGLRHPGTPFPYHPAQPGGNHAGGGEELHWPGLQGPFGFIRGYPPHAATISRTIAGVPYEQLHRALIGWVDGVVRDRQVNALVDGKRAKQSKDAAGNPLGMMNVLAHDLKLCLAQWPMTEKRYEPRVLRAPTGSIVRALSGTGGADHGALYA